MGMPDQTSEISEVHDIKPSSTVWIIVGVCAGIFLIIFILFIVLYCRKQKEKSSKKLSKSNISYPASLATSRSGERILHENGSVKTENYSQQLHTVVQAPTHHMSDSEGSDDEISRPKREALERATYEDYTDESEYSSDDDLDPEIDSKIVFIPKIKQQEIHNSAKDDIEFLKEMEKEHERRHQ